MLMQNFGATMKKHYGMLWYFLEWPILYHFLFKKLVGSNSMVRGIDETQQYWNACRSCVAFQSAHELQSLLGPAPCDRL